MSSSSLQSFRSLHLLINQSLSSGPCLPHGIDRFEKFATGTPRRSFYLVHEGSLGAAFILVHQDVADQKMILTALRSWDLEVTTVERIKDLL